MAFAWSPKGDRLLFLGPERLSTHLYSISARGGTVQRLSREGRVHGLFSLSQDGKRMAFMGSDPTMPWEIFVSPTSLGSCRGA
jgi:Tol biopolymer transport system component